MPYQPISFHGAENGNFTYYFTVNYTYLNLLKPSGYCTYYKF
jgi:hypothetical protein